MDAIHNRLFAAAVLDGKYPDLVLQYMERFGVGDQIDQDALADAVETIDYLGVNYYNINHIAHDPDAEMIGQWPGVDGAVLATPPGNLTEMEWGVEPVGLTWMLNRVTRWAPDVPLLIMENGAAYPDEVSADGEVHDLHAGVGCPPRELVLHPLGEALRLLHAVAERHGVADHGDAQLVHHRRFSDSLRFSSGAP